MNPLSASKILRIVIAGAAALVLVAPAGAGDSTMLAQYGWGAAATFAKQQTRFAASAEDDLLARYGWGAAATYAKLHA
jgi:hypothetical protein